MSLRKNNLPNSSRWFEEFDMGPASQLWYLSKETGLTYTINVETDIVYFFNNNNSKHPVAIELHGRGLKYKTWEICEVDIDPYF